ncbi:head GIN domain-containing protein [Sphingosinithalassobacter sp. LHW66-3]|uniref:head GIN domain-containing protein n=1 Tax=Sphingosinithalassobacter sp. LHW66-3 TaxID=3424718 RepID=UPI003D6A2F77
MRALAAIILLPLAACGGPGAEREAPAVSNGGTAEVRNFDASNFTGVELRGSDDVDVAIGERFAVRAEGDARALDRLEIEVVDGMLRISRRSSNGNWFSDDDAHVYVTMPRITAASVSGSGNMRVARAEGDFRGAVSGSGDLDLAELATERAELSVSGSGDLSAAGRTRALDASVSGSGDIDAERLTADAAQVSIAGSGDVSANVDGDASVSIAGSGDAELGANARCSVRANGSGSARCG